MPSAYDCFVQVATERFGAIDTKLAQKARDAEQCPAHLLGHLAWSRGLDYWGDWSEATKRELIKQTPANLRRRGTRHAINVAVQAFETEITIEEWWEQTPEGTPGTAKATIEQDSYVETDPVAQETIVRLLARESRKSIHWLVITGVLGADAIGDESRARLTSLHQFSGVQSGA